MKSRSIATAIATAAFACSLVVPGLAGGAGKHSASTLPLYAVFPGKWTRPGCPAGTPETTQCFSFVGQSTVRGLGRATETYGQVWDQADVDCWHSAYTPAVIAVAGKGQIDVALTDPYACDPKSTTGNVGFTVNGGSGVYAGATGSGTIVSVAQEDGTFADTWSGSISVAGLEFDTAAPAISGAVPRTARAPKRAKRVRVSYSVTATDAVDGSVPVSCKPASGGLFRVGRTRVACSATDASGNTGQASFTITVKRA